ncbi:glucan endo-1,3-beta-glucosidase 7-like [Wolffia australiana]
MAPPQTSAFFVFFFFLSTMAAPGLGGFVGVNYGRVANNLPPPAKVVELLKSRGISEVKLYDADPTVLSALSKSGIGVVVAIQNELLSEIAARPAFAMAWVKKNVAAWLPSTHIRAIAVGNEVFASPMAKTLTPALVQAMKNIHSALTALRLDHLVKVSSPIALTALQSSYPPSSGVFRPDLAVPVMKPMLELLNGTGSYLMVNAYPFFAYEANAGVISLDYALFRPNGGVVDGGTGRRYLSLLDAQLDAVGAAMTGLGFGDVDVVVSETGWPSKGDGTETGASVENAAAYNGNLARRVLAGDAGTPTRPGGAVGVYLFALFNENLKPGPGSERNYGLFFPDEASVYDVQFKLHGVATRRDQSAGASGGGSGGVSGGVGAASGGGGGEWCVADGRVGEERLQKALDYACGEGGADCGGIQPGAGCFAPNTVVAHASYAFNSYFQKMKRAAGSCFFGGAALVVSQEPRFGDCVLPTGD